MGEEQHIYDTDFQQHQQLALTLSAPENLYRFTAGLNRCSTAPENDSK